MNNFLRIVLAALIACSTFLYAADTPKVSIAFAQLKHSLDFSKVQPGEQIELKLLRSVFVNGQNILPRDSVLVAHVSKVESEGKHLRLHLVLDNAKVRGEEIEVPLQGIIVALAREAKQPDLASDPQASMMRSIEPTTRDSAGSSSAVDSSAAVTTAVRLHKESGGTPLTLNENSQGVIDIDAKLDWNLATPPPETIIESKGKKLTLQAGTQVLIRMAQPRL